MRLSFVVVTALLAAARAQTIILAECTAQAAPIQTWKYNAQARNVILAASGGCLQLETGCCGGEEIRSGDVLQIQKCEPNYQSQMIGWPAAGGQAPWSIPSLNTEGEPETSPTVGGALVFDGAGYFFPGAPVNARAYDPVSSTFNVNGTTDSALLIHAASGLCLTAGGNGANIEEQLNLQKCKPVEPVGVYTSTQLFSVQRSGAIVTSHGKLLSAEKVLGARGTWPGAIRLISVNGNAQQPYYSQTFSLVNKTLVASGLGLVADVSNGTWWGTPVFLTDSPAGLASTTFAFVPSSANPGVGQIVHAATGLCVDAGGVPYGHNCLHPAVRGLPYCDNTLPKPARLADLVSRLTLPEAISLLGSSPENNAYCGSTQPAIPRLDITPLQRLTEVSSMASSSCGALSPYNASCATSFPAGMIRAGAFNRTAWLQHGVVVGNEIRGIANVNLGSTSGYGPDINQPRDPRNGRNGELQSEDPFLSGEVAKQYVQGMQFGGVAPVVNSWDQLPTQRMLAALKHYTAYSLETDRFGSKGNISIFDMWDTYLPQYELSLTQAWSAGTMCSYMSVRLTNSTSGAFMPSCANPYILTTVVREFWNRPDATHLSDCGAVWNMWTANYFVNNATASAAVSINAGMDMNSNSIVPTELAIAIADGLITPTPIFAAASRLLGQRFLLGDFDPLESLPAAVASLSPADVGTPDNYAAAAEHVAQGTVLLKNDGGVLPLKVGRRLAVLGPTALSATAHIGDIYGGGYCINGNDCVPLIGNELSNTNGNASTVVLAGVSINGNDSSWGVAIAAVADVDVVVLSLGTDRSVAGEGNDRNDIGLPGIQSQFSLEVLAAAHAANVPVVLLLVHNLPVSFDELVQPANSTYTPVAAIVDAWAPTMGAPTLAQLLFGTLNRWGKSVLTVYPHTYQNEVSLFSFDMSLAPGRSYKYYTGTPLVVFGSGMSYSTFSVACSGGYAGGPSTIGVACNVSNTAGPDGDEVLQVYHRAGADVIARVAGAHPIPLLALVDFERVSVPAGSVGSVSFSLTSSRLLAYVNENGASVVYPGTHYIDISNGNGANITITLTVSAEQVVRSPPLPTDW